MKKYFFSIISVLILAVLTSCSGLTDSYSQVSVEFPEGTSNQLTLLRAADNTSSNITCLLKTTGDYEATATANYSSAEELNNKQITISGIPVNKTIAVKLQLLVDNQLLYEGISEKITVQKGDNLVNMKIKPAKVEVSFETAEFGIAAFDKNGKNTGNKLMYNEEDVYRIAPTLNGELFIPENAEVEWFINGTISTDSSFIYDEDEKGNPLSIFNTEVLPYLTFNSNAFGYNNTKLRVQYVIIPETNLISTASGTFELTYPDDNSGVAPTITNNTIESNIVLWDWVYDGYYSTELKQYQTQNIADVIDNIKSDDNKIADTKSKYFFLKNGETEDFDIDYDDIKYYDIENNTYYTAEKVDDNYRITFNKANILPNNDDYFIVDSSFTLNTKQFAANKDYFVYSGYKEITKQKVISVEIFKIQNQSIIEKANVPLFTFAINLEGSNGFEIKDMIILQSKLFMVVSRFQHENTPDKYQQGALVVIDLENPNNKRVIGFTNTTKTYTSSGGSVYVTGLQENSPNNFFAPHGIVAIKKDELYIADTGALFDEEKKSTTPKNRVISVNLKTFALSKVSDIDMTFETISKSSSFDK